jgi:hypothetical protein
MPLTHAAAAYPAGSGGTTLMRPAFTAILICVCQARPGLSGLGGGEARRPALRRGRGYRARVRVRTAPQSRRFARRLISHAFAAAVRRDWDGYDKSGGVIWRVSGWRSRIGLGGSQTFCSRRGRTVDGPFRTDNGWDY